MTDTDTINDKETHLQETPQASVLRDHSPPNEVSELDAPDVGMLPPMRLALFLIAGITLDWLIPINFGSGWGWLGLVLIIAALGFGKWAIQCFKAAGTNVPPNKPALMIVTDGPFQYTRNPMYISMLSLYAGTAMLADAPLMLLLTAGLWYVLDRQVIAKEEAYLGAKFGEPYMRYKAKVRRWV